MGEKLTTAEVFNLYDQNHPDIIPYMNRVFNVLGVACVTLINMFDTEKIVIGGGVSNSGETLFNPIRTYVQSYALNPDGRKTEIVPSQQIGRASCRERVEITGVTV